MKSVDLHTHSRYSDGTLVPAELVKRAAENRLEMMILTDHDTVSGFPEAREAGEAISFDVRCGIEINTNRSDQVHILGYGIDWREPAFAAQLKDFRGRRAVRVGKMVSLLQGQGLDISVEDVKAGSTESLGRPHVADALRRKGIVKNRKTAFSRYLMPGKPGYVPSMGPTPVEAIRLVRSVGGFAVLAHPQTLSDWDDFDAWLKEGLEGLEAYYGAHSPSVINKYVDMAREHGLLVTGGSDFHMPQSSRETYLGVKLPEEVCAVFMERLQKCSSCRS